MSLRLHYAVRSDVGHVREGNEDSAYAGARLIAVADGMGGHAAGEVASSTVISQLASLDEDIAASEILEALADSVDEANAQLRAMSIEDGSLEGMGTTVTALLLAGTRLGVLHVGDSRAYLLRDQVLNQVTHDHTLVQDLVDQGRITPEQADTHPQRSLLMRALDGRDVEPDLSIRETTPDDRYLLCTDGLSGVVTEATIFEALLLPTPQEAVDRLVELALKGGGPDNITVVVADVVDENDVDGDEPLVAGAAAEKRIVPGATPARTGPNPRYPDQESPAAKGARIGRPGAHRHEPEPDHPVEDRSNDPTRRRVPRPALIGLFAVVLLGAAVAGSWIYVHSQYYVGVDKEHVAIFEGINTSFAGISLHKVREQEMPLSELTELARNKVKNGYPVSSLTEARDFVKRLRETPLLTTNQATATATPTAASTATSGTDAAAQKSTGSVRGNLGDIASAIPSCDPIVTTACRQTATATG
ncbi:PP2C family serine/threonine-protein phosphatase [Frankia sp. Cppng1_Ct_nod]|uniref:PP2C family protein-serine/threonine phosphatase n=1 Tax=Frankia sp. Cppng1_Ct_nod TaxID=2897162 RepID=UPI0010418365|nr:PP2C family serine/threonine-protein phosphatase [Frankia sp. Cppng1_Ct_nod]